MVKLVAIYKRPADVAAFEEHYWGVHVPLVRQWPSLQRFEVARVTAALMGEDDLYQIAEMYFESADDMRAALRSEPGRAAGKDLATFAPGLCTLYATEVVDQEAGT